MKTVIICTYFLLDTSFNRSARSQLTFTRHSPHLPSSPSLGASKLRCYLLTILFDCFVWRRGMS
jgi:hypothetical protein